MKNIDRGILNYSITVSENKTEFDTSISAALATAEIEMMSLSETIESLKKIQVDCDKVDYALAAGSGALCGIIDVFLVGKPGESPIGEVTDKWFVNRTEDFARRCGWDGDKQNLSSAVRYLEKKFKIPYDQNGIGDIAREQLELTPANHHFKSLGHNPTILGLFFSILDQFKNTSHFVSNGELIIFSGYEGDFQLKGKNVLSKLFCGFTNWIGHLISDMSGASGSKGRGMGIPSPIWAWANDIIAIKRKMKIEASTFDKAFNEIALNIYNRGYDIRFQSAQTIPVLLNELIVRLFYSVRRMYRYFMESHEYSFKQMWTRCEPFTNSTVKRMLTVAHGTFCLIDLGDVLVKSYVTGGAAFNISEFFMRINIAGVGRFAISLYGEAVRTISSFNIKAEAEFAKKESKLVEFYIDGLKILSQRYDDQFLLDFVRDLKTSNAYISAFEKTVSLAELRSVPEDKILRNKADIDNYFLCKEK